MGKLLYLEGSSGIAGDMTVAALLDLGGSREKLDAVLHSLGVPGFSWIVGRRKSKGLEGCSFDVVLEDHEHDHEHHHEHEHEHHHDHDHEHEHDDAHHHDHEHHHHEHRNFADVCAVIDRGAMTPRAAELAKKIFSIVAEAESQAHGVPVEQVHFHEVGALDSIADIVGAAVLIDDLDITECVVTGLSEGQGRVRCQHGEIPVPVPAVANIARKWQIPLSPSGVQGEMVTPTGIAIAAALRTRRELPAKYRIVGVGSGVGKREFPHANILRAMLIEEENSPQTGVWMLEANIDDASGEMLGYAMEKLLEAGALDVHYIPCFMKKNRPGWLLRVMVSGELVEKTEELIFRHTTTIGLRKSPLTRSCMERESIEVELPQGAVAVKKCSWGELVKYYPEYESVKALCDRTGADFLTVYEAAAAAAACHDE